MILTHAERAERRRQVAQYASRHGISAAASHYNLSLAYTRTVSREHGCAPTRAQEMNVGSFEVLRMLLDGVSGVEISRQCEIVPQRVSQVKKRAEAAGFVFGTK